MFITRKLILMNVCVCLFEYISLRFCVIKDTVYRMKLSFTDDDDRRILYSDAVIFMIRGYPQQEEDNFTFV